MPSGQNCFCDSPQLFPGRSHSVPISRCLDCPIVDHVGTRKSTMGHGRYLGDSVEGNCSGCGHRDWGTLPKRTGQLRVGLLSPCWLVGGVERWWMTLARHSRDVQFTGVGLTGTNLLSNIALSEASGLMWLTTRVQTFLEECDIVIVWGETRAFPLSQPAVFAIHGDAEWTRMRRRAWSHLPAVAVSSAAAAQVDPEAIVICNGVDMQRLSKQRERSEVRTIWLAHETEKLLLYVGRFSSEKQPLRAAEVARKLGRNYRSVYCCPDLTHSQAGAIRTIDPLAIFANGTTANDEHIGDVYRACDVLVHGSENEGFCLAISEALACGLPVVSNPIGSFLEPQLQNVGFHPYTGDWELATTKAIEMQTPQRVDWQTSIMRQFTAERMATEWEQYLSGLHQAAATGAAHQG